MKNESTFGSQASSASSPALRLPGSPVRRSKLRALGLSLLFAAMLSPGTGCGYHLQGTGGTLPAAVKIIAVLPFERQVPVLQLDQRVTEAVTRELAQRERVKVQSVKEGADAV